MTELTCDSVCEAAMAVFDGGPSELNSAAIEAHLAVCPTCYEDIEQLKGLATWLSRQKRLEQTTDLWPVIRRELNQSEYGRRESAGWRPFVFLTVLLLGYKLVEIVPQGEMGAIFKLIPVLVVIGVFCYLRENPFKVNTLLTLEGE